MEYAFPAVFYPDDGGVGVRFYDADWFTCGNDIADAVEMAEDLLGGRLMEMEQNGEQIPTPTPLSEVYLTPFQTVRMIYVDTEKYAKELEEQLQREKIALSENPIKAICELREWTVKELADFLNAPYSTIQEWNTGKTQPPKWITALIIDKVQSA